MVQPYDYSLKIASPGEAFLQAVQVGQQRAQIMNQRDKIRMEQEAVKREQQFQADLAAWTQNPTPDGYKNLASKYPTEFQTLAGVRKEVGAIDRPAIRAVAGEALVAHRQNMPERVVEILDQRIEASKDNPALQQKFVDMRKGYQSIKDNPALQESVIATLLEEDEEGSRIYRNAFKKTEKYVIAGNNVFTLAEINAAVAESERSGNPNIGVKPVIPQGAISDLKSNPKLAADFDAKYGTPANPNPSAQILGGQTDKPSGTFQGQ